MGGLTMRGSGFVERESGRGEGDGEQASHAEPPGNASFSFFFPLFGGKKTKRVLSPPIIFSTSAVAASLTYFSSNPLLLAESAFATTFPPHPEREGVKPYALNLKR